jgi:hypothetical protein
MLCFDIVKDAYPICYYLCIVFAPLILKVIGAVGTGKSIAIDTITSLIRQMFQRNNAVHVLATTGAAAFNIEGKALYSFAGLVFHDLYREISTK